MIKKFHPFRFRGKMRREGVAPPLHNAPEELASTDDLNFSSESLRDAIADELWQHTGDERREAVKKVREMPEYWRARAQKMRKLDGRYEEMSDDWLEVFVRNKTLYHGSYTEGITHFEPAAQTFFGQGVYLTPEARDAIGYAFDRSHSTLPEHGGEETAPVLYEVNIKNMKMLDLQWDENLSVVAERFFKWYTEGVQDGSVEEDEDVLTAYRGSNIREDARDVFQVLLRGNNSAATALFTHYVRSLGYDGIISKRALSNKETPSAYNNIGDHVAYLIFDPEHVHIQQEQKMDLSV
ncbi:MAG: hypothetical protein OXB96_00960 [Candidatus Kaiserbacteria bacterium]|nr:hypothetical protein [Candidatus Kaiserbacteria bacterium]